MEIEHIALWAQHIEVLKSFYKKYFNAKSNKKYSNPNKKFSSCFLSFSSDTRLEIMQMPFEQNAKKNRVEITI